MNLETFKTILKDYLATLHDRLVNEFRLLLLGQKHFIADHIEELVALGCEYDSDYEIVVYSLSTSSKPNSVLDYKEEKTDLYPASLLNTPVEDEDESFDVKATIFMDWVADCWKEAKTVNPKVRAFLYVHDSYRGIDLDNKTPFNFDSDDLENICKKEGIVLN